MFPPKTAKIKALFNWHLLELNKYQQSQPDAKANIAMPYVSILPMADKCISNLFFSLHIPIQGNLTPLG